MEEEEIRIFDLQRIFLGDLDPAFALEVAFRTGFMFLYTVAIVRLLGKRGMGQLSPFELVIIIALGSAVGDPMLYPDVPLVHAMVVVTVVVLLQRALVRASDRNSAIEKFVESEPRRLVLDGVLDLDALTTERFARDELFVTLREEGIEHLGQVKRAYLEPSGRVSVWMYQPGDSLPGLPILPQNDPDFPAPTECHLAPPFEGTAACCACGYIVVAKRNTPIGECPACKDSLGWVEAVDTSDEGDGSTGRTRKRRRNPLTQ